MGSPEHVCSDGKPASQLHVNNNVIRSSPYSIVTHHSHSLSAANDTVLTPTASASTSSSSMSIISLSYATERCEGNSSPTAEATKQDVALASTCAPPVQEHPSCAEAEQPLHDVQTFLRSLQPPMDHLAPQFALGGISNRQCLIGLAHLPKREQNEFLMENLDLNFFQALTIRSALKCMRSSANPGDA
ncbi:hypothetical protein NM688_g1176 [Phlebia brevispora]|uniref:Uncharacterized protein n=1 Tax=Phlebia brevispora TaxID=194682 RepID=A0ACC1TCH1_9APHY|nr:hypothetical protein NM688_g1176 [Phlebia brevispora]